MTFTHMKICCPNCNGMPDGCEECNETGLCCPVCRGAKFLGRHRKAKGSVMERCPTCQVQSGDGWQFEGRRAMAAIDQYIDDWFAGNVPDEVETRRRECERAKLQAEEWRTHNRPVWKHG